MVTTIQISNELKRKLEEMKIHPKERYEDVIWDMIEDRMEIGKEIVKEIEEAKKDIKKGRFTTLEELKKKLGL